MEIKICIVVPYFGELPRFFRWWYESAIKNSEIDFHLVTDQEVAVKQQSNFFVHQMSFDILCEKLNYLLGAKYFKYPYKLCDFKPAYGYLFNDIVSDYDYWGYADIDLIFGDISKLINKPGIFKIYDKILDLGHLSFYKNSKFINKVFCNTSNNFDYWPYIRDSEIIWVYDESYNGRLIGINGRILDIGLKLYAERVHFSDVDPKYLGFYDINNDPDENCFFWSFSDELRRTSFVNNKIVETEIVYAHFQKREVRVIDCSGGIRIYLPSHWPDCFSYDEAINCMILLKDADRKVNLKYRNWKMDRKIKKYMLLFKEVLFLKGATKFFFKTMFRLF